MVEMAVERVGIGVEDTRFHQNLVEKLENGKLVEDTLQSNLVHDPVEQSFVKDNLVAGNLAPDSPEEDTLGKDKLGEDILVEYRVGEKPVEGNLVHKSLVGKNLVVVVVLDGEYSMQTSQDIFYKAEGRGRKRVRITQAPSNKKRGATDNTRIGEGQNQATNVCCKSPLSVRAMRRYLLPAWRIVDNLLFNDLVISEFAVKQKSVDENQRATLYSHKLVHNPLFTTGGIVFTFADNLFTTSDITFAVSDASFAFKEVIDALIFPPSWRSTNSFDFLDNFLYDARCVEFVSDGLGNDLKSAWRAPRGSLSWRSNMSTNTSTNANG
jgi:hypothetical protein